MYELPGVGAFHPNETLYVWINVTNDQDNYKDLFLIVKTESYRIDPKGNSSFIAKSEVFLAPKEGDNVAYAVIPIDGWNVTQNPIYGQYSYKIIYSVYKASDNSLLDLGGIGYDNLYSIEGGPPALMPTILSIRVVDKNSIPIPRARVYIDNQFKGQTFSTGVFSFQDPLLGSHTIKVSKSGYKDAVYGADIKSGQTNSVTLRLESTIEEIASTPVPSFTPRPIPGFDAIFALTALVLTVYGWKSGRF